MKHNLHTFSNLTDYIQISKCRYPQLWGYTGVAYSVNWSIKSLKKLIFTI